MALFTFRVSSLRMEHENCGCTIHCLQSTESLGFHKQLSIGGVTVCATYMKSDIPATWSRLACVLRSLVFGPSLDSGSLWVPMGAFPSLYVVLEFASPLLPPSIQRMEMSVGAAELRVGGGSSATVSKWQMDSQISGFFSHVFCSNSSCSLSETDLNWSLLYWFCIKNEQTNPHTQIEQFLTKEESLVLPTLIYNFK